MRVTWNKRYITLAPVATLIGLAIKVYDPEGLLGDEHDLGVTTVMVPADTEGVHHGPRHLPMNTPFMNGPTWGHDVFIPLDQVIGGRDMVGQGWRMLLECLSIGRSISLPGLGTSAGKMACLTTGSYAAVREQFGRSISDFEEGVQEAMEPMAGYTWMMDSARIFTAGMLDRGVKPSVSLRRPAEIPQHGPDADRGKQRHGRGRRPRCHPWAAQLPGAHLPGHSHRHYGGGREHPDPQPDGLRPGRYPLPPLHRAGD